MALQTHASVPLSESPKPPVDALRRLLADLASVVATLDAPSYSARLLPRASGSIGEHVRHCLDHVAALVAARSSRPLSYDNRERGTSVECDPAEALRQIMRLDAALERWPGRSFDEPIRVTGKLSATQDFSAWSTLGRELEFVVSHTIHHQALIAVLLETLGASAPERFGYAPSTPARSS